MLSFLEFLTVYHGSKVPVEKLDPSKQVSGYYPGFYTTSDEIRAATFGSHIFTLQIDPSKFYHLKDDKQAEMLKNEARQAGYYVNSGSGTGEVKYLKDQGYHGIRRGNEFIVFHRPSQ